MSVNISGDTGVDKATNQAVKDAMGVTGTAPIFGCRAWVNFDGTRNEADTGASVIGQNVKIRASGNVSSVLKNGTGDYTVNFTTAMVDANYGACALNGGSLMQSITSGEINALRTTSGIRIASLNQVGSFIDSAYITTTIFR